MESVENRKEKEGMKECKLLSWRAALVVGALTMNGSAGTSWDLENNRVTYSVFQDNFELGYAGAPNYEPLAKSIHLSQLDLNQVAIEEGFGTAANYLLSSVVLSMNGTVYGTVYFKNNSGSSVTPAFKVAGDSALAYASAVTPSESYSQITAIGTIAPGNDYSADINIAGSVTPKTVMITEDLNRFLGIGTIETIGTFPVEGYFVSGGTDWTSTVQLQGKADISVTYNYAQVPEPTSVALLMMGCVVLALRRQRVSTR